MLFPDVSVEPEIKDVFPALKIGVLVSPVHPGATSPELQALMDSILNEVAESLDAEFIRNIPAVRSAKEAYKILGKDPNRYRPAAESLLRRVSKRKGLYHVNSVVDCLNLVSVKTGFSICGYDLDKIEGNILLGQGRAGEFYEGIGRGSLNIENLPVFRDARGAFGNPTSDSIRTGIDQYTNRVLMLLPAFDGNSEGLREALELLADYLKRFAGTDQTKTEIIRNP